MGKIRPCDIHPPCQKSIPINIPRDWDVLNVFFDENNNNMTVDEWYNYWIENYRNS